MEEAEVMIAKLQPMASIPAAGSPVLVKVGTAWILATYCHTRLGGSAWYELRKDSTDKNYRLIPSGKITNGLGWVALNPDAWQ